MLLFAFYTEFWGYLIMVTLSLGIVSVGNKCLENWGSTQYVEYGEKECYC
jgi:hypothetical protein